MDKTWQDLSSFANTLVGGKCSRKRTKGEKFRRKIMRKVLLHERDDTGKTKNEQAGAWHRFGEH